MKKRIFFAILALAGLFVFGFTNSTAQIVPTLSTSQIVPPLGTIPLSNSNLLLQSDESSTQPELPGLGHKFELLGVMKKDTDPENSEGNPGGSGGGVGGNETISATTTQATPVAIAFRRLPPGIKITALENQLGIKYYFQAPKTCVAGTPRLSLLIDSDGDGDTDFAAHGHLNPPLFAGCPVNAWRYEDLTDHLVRWEVTPATAVPPPFGPIGPIGGAGAVNWDGLEAAITGAFPNHRVTAGFLVEDSCSFSGASCGKSYYDLLTIENRTLEIWHDAVGGNQ